MTAAARSYAARQAEFFAERERSRAEMCECGHNRFAHQDEVAGCAHYRDCNCFSFQKEIK